MGFKLTKRAYEDLINIGRYTLREWGKTKRDSYLQELDFKFRHIAETPRVGRHRPEIKEGYYSSVQGSHVIFYMIEGGDVVVIGILHQSMDVLKYFDRK